MDDVMWLDATGQAALVRTGEVSARELAEAAIARIEQVDGELNAVIHRRFSEALDEIAAGLPSGPFTGVPFLVKDLFADTAGDPAHHGNRALKQAGWRAPADCWLTARYRRAGLVLLGRTNTPELGLVPVTEPEAYGPCRNPWDTSRSPGGSSGGSAAAVAAGMVAVAHASDGGGSIRIPSSMCGLVGLKPSRGRITAGPDRDESGLSVQHVVTRSVRDCAALLDATAGPGPGDMAIAPPPARPYVEELSTRPTGLRVGLLAHTPNGTLHPHCEQAVHSAARLLESLGHHVVEEHPAALDDPDNGRRFMARWNVNTRLSVLGIGELLGREIGPDDVEPLTWALATAAESASAVDYARAMAASARFTRQLGLWWQDHDLLLTPTLGEPPPRVGELTPPADAPFATQARTAALVPFTTHFNVSGQPAISLPLEVSPDGLPIGVQLVAGYGREDLLLQVAAELEEAAPWSGRRPML
ncbi:MAG TPA: amidase [Acidimicrobiales bacterium]|nr:amidase [Acidimicrobiales bacterium]